MRPLNESEVSHKYIVKRAPLFAIRKPNVHFLGRKYSDYEIVFLQTDA